MVLILSEARSAKSKDAPILSKWEALYLRRATPKT
jgi:hypothetical protein